jgi:hypothetical protein
MPLKDVGNGIQQFVPDGGAAEMEQLKNTYSLVDLVNRVQQAPVEMAGKQADLALKQHQIEQLPLADLKARTDLLVQQNGEFRAQAKFQADAMIDIHKAFAQDFSLGEAILQKSVPGAIATQSKDGIVNVAIPSGKGRFRTIQIDPQNIADPEKRIAIQDSRRKEWEATAKPYLVVSGQFENMKKLSALGTGPADLGMVYAYNKMLDPNSAVREGEVLTAQNSPGLTESYRNLYNRALETGAPMFGGPGSAARKSFLDAAAVLKDTSKQNLIQLGQNAYNTATEERLNAKAILSPFGDVTYAAITGQGAKAIAEQGAKNQPPVTQPNQQQPSANPRRPLQEAGVLPTSGGQPPAQAPAVKTMDALNTWKKQFAAPQNKAPQSSADKPQTVIQNGHTYRLNQRTGNYE